MTVVVARVSRPDSSGLLTPMRGYLKWEPFGNRAASTSGIVLPVPFTVPLEEGGASVTVEPTTGQWAWKVTYQLLSYPHEIHHYAVPDVTSIELSALVEVDPATLTPTAAPDAAWYSALELRAATQVSYVQVETGEEDRPDYGSVFWLGGTSRPVNMRDGTDLWMQAQA